MTTNVAAAVNMAINSIVTPIVGLSMTLKTKSEEVSLNSKKPVLDYVPFLVDISLAILTLSTGIYTLSQEKIELKHIAMMFITLFGALAFKNISTDYANKKRKDELDEKLDANFKSIVDSYAGNGTFTYIGKASRAIEIIAQDLSRARDVRNTDLYFKIRRRIIDEKEQKAREPIYEYVKSGTAWVDIVSPNFLEKPNIDLAEKQIRDHSDEKLRYQLMVTPRSFPAVNFVLLGFGEAGANDKIRVYFGWGRHDKEHNGPVFVSDDERLVSMFDDIWKCLYDDAIPYDIFRQTYELHEDVVGVWANISFDERQNRVRNGATMVIREGRGGRLQIEGTIYGGFGKTQLERIGSFRSTSVRYASRRLYFSYERSSALSASDDGDLSIDGNASAALMVLTLTPGNKKMSGFAIIGDRGRVGITSERLSPLRPLLESASEEYERESLAMLGKMAKERGEASTSPGPDQ